MAEPDPSVGTYPVAYAWGFGRKKWSAAGFVAVVAVAVAAEAVVGRRSCM